MEQNHIGQFIRKLDSLSCFLSFNRTHKHMNHICIHLIAHDSDGAQIIVISIVDFAVRSYIAPNLITAQVDDTPSIK